MSAQLKLACINIEKSKHLDGVTKFLLESDFEVVCVQEMFQRDIERLTAAFPEATCQFAPMTLRATENPPEVLGVGIFSRLPVKKRNTLYYHGHPESLPESSQLLGNFNESNRVLLSCDIEKDGLTFRVCTTHFTWTPDGEATKLQHDDMAALLNVLSS